MRTKSILTLLVMAAAALTFGLSEAKADPDVNVQINGYLPAPQGVNVLVDSGRPYYVERDRRIYLERDQRGKHYKNKKMKKQHHDNGNKYGHDKEKKHDK
jgi:hypothetical protein